jgi:hypothetical protein
MGIWDVFKRETPSEKIIREANERTARAQKNADAISKSARITETNFDGFSKGLDRRNDFYDPASYETENPEAAARLRRRDLSEQIELASQTERLNELKRRLGQKETPLLSEEATKRRLKEIKDSLGD